MAEQGYRSRVGGSGTGKPVHTGHPDTRAHWGGRRHHASCIVVASNLHISCHTAPGQNTGPVPSPGATSNRGL